MDKYDEKIVWIHKSVYEKLSFEADSKHPMETGGILMGYFGNPDNVSVITHATGPSPNAVHLRSHYKPDQDFDEFQIASMYFKSNRRTVYLGDWHSHPAPFDGLSNRDKRTLRKIALYKSARIKTPLMLILSCNSQWNATIWRGEIIKNYWYKSFLVNKCTVAFYP